MMGSAGFAALILRSVLEHGIHTPGESKVRRVLPAVFLLSILRVSAAESPHPVRVIVFPLEGPSDPGELSWLSEGVALSISDQIAGPEVQTLGREERIAAVEELDLPPAAALSRASAIRVAQKARADKIVLGKFVGESSDLKISIRVLDLGTMKFSGEMSANGPLSALPEMENELSWLILGIAGKAPPFPRESFAARTRRIPNDAYASYVQSLNAAAEKEKLRLLLKAVGACDAFPAAQYQIGRIYFRRGDCANAMRHLPRGSGAGNFGPESDFMRGTCLLLQGSPGSAIEVLEQAAGTVRTLSLLNNLGAAYLRKGEMETAKRFLGEASKLSPSDSAVSINLSIAEYKQGNLLEACALLENAVRAHPKNGMLHFVLGFLLRERGEQEKAAAEIKKAADLGVAVEKLQRDDPVSWSRLWTSWQ